MGNGGNKKEAELGQVNKALQLLLLSFKVTITFEEIIMTSGKVVVKNNTNVTSVNLALMYIKHKYFIFRMIVNIRSVYMSC